MITNMLKNIYIPFYLLIAIGSVIVLELSPVLAKAFGYPSYHFVFNHLIYIGIGMVLLYVLKRLGDVWFDRIGAAILIVSIVSYMLVVLVVGSKTSYEVLHITGFTIRYTILFIVGVIWLMDFISRQDGAKYHWPLSAAALSIFVFWILLFEMSTPLMILLGVTVIMTIWYKAGFSKLFFYALGGMTGALTILLMYFPHLIKQIVPPTELNLLGDRMHEGLFLYNDWSTVALVVISILFLWLVYALWQYQILFAKSVAILLGLDMLMHWLVFANLSPMIPPSLFIVEYGKSITLISFVMIGMVSMRKV